MNHRIVHRLAAIALLVTLGACSPIYVLRAGYEEMKILSRRQSITKLVADPATPEPRRDKLQLVLTAREFAREPLGLDVGDSYTTFSQLDSDTLALIVSAAKKDAFEPFTWWFPIVGHVPYKGYFSESKARKAMRDLENKGYDTYLRPTSAFSTLGWFNDPLVSPLLRYDSISLANTVIHELTHNTFYAAGQAALNESFANFVGARGAIAYFCSRHHPSSDICQRATAAWEDELVYGDFLSGVVDSLEALYAREDLSFEETLEMRERVFNDAQLEFRDEVTPRLQVLSFASFSRLPLNNATLISRRLYYRRLDLFEDLYQATGGDLNRTIALVVETASAADDPYAAVERLVAQIRGSN